MAKRKTRTDEEKTRDKDKRLRDKFGITLADRDERARQQDNKCKICGCPLDPPCVDHFHFRIQEFRNQEGAEFEAGFKWHAKAYDVRGNVFSVWHDKTKEAARAGVKKMAMPYSIRSLLCRHCNRALGVLERWFDAARYPDKVLPSLDYLRDWLKKGNYIDDSRK